MINGYRVRTTFRALRPEEEEMKRRSIIQAVWGSFKKKGEGEEKKSTERLGLEGLEERPTLKDYRWNDKLPREGID